MGDSFFAQPILGLRFAATAYDKDGRRLPLGDEYHLPPDSSDRLVTSDRPFLFRFAATEEYFGTIQDACHP